MEGIYTIVANKDGTYNVVRMAPTVISQGLKLGEAEALAFALSTQVRLLEGTLAR
ncbi:hypothetical protein [Bradyrhizobium lupini]|uniref:hypothetical protein n=1 Tax=Rhizobium lupini TaxID=136996 RepID=UPI0034C6B34C